MTRRILIAVSIAMSAILSQPVWASEVTGLTTFVAGTPAKASEVNANFTAVKAAVDDSHAQILAMQQTIASLQQALEQMQTTIDAQASELAAQALELGAQATQLAALRTSQVMALEPYLTVSTADTPKVTLAGANLQIVNGRGTTATTNGAGNLIIGYDEPRTDGALSCSIGTTTAGVLIVDEAGCSAASGVWARSHKTGSHNLIVGARHNYSSYGGVVLGWRNMSNQPFTSIVGGSYNQASGNYSVVSGGFGNTASGTNSSVGGGSDNRATAHASSVSGGLGNISSASQASVSGGVGNRASGLNAHVSGGWNNQAAGNNSSVSGGALNNASGANSSVSGGSSVNAATDNSWAAGTLSQP